MLGRVAAYGAAAVIMLPLVLFPAHSTAKGFAGGATGFAVPAHLSIRGFAGHARHKTGFLHRDFPFRAHHHHHASYPYGYWSAFDSGDYARTSVAYPVYVGPRCLHSVQTVIVPREGGGQQRVRITRC